MKIAKDITKEYKLEIGSLSKEDWEYLHSLLRQIGFREIIQNESGLHAVRGTIFWSLFNVGSPFKLYQTISVSEVGITYHIKTLYSIFIEDEEDEFFAEALAIKEAIVSHEWDKTRLQKVARKSLIKSLYFLLGCAIAGGIVGYLWAVFF